MTLEEYIEKNFSEEQLNEYSYFSGWHNTILEIVRETWVAAQHSVQADLPTTWAEDEHPSACIHRQACIFYKPASR